MRQETRQLIGMFGALALLAGCQTGQQPFAFLKKNPEAATAAAEPAAPAAGPVSERDVEAPEIFEADEAGLWDGRPSLGGVWVAHPDVKDPERVIIRNNVNGKFVIGALFRRERDNPGPRLQISSDAASALDLLAGQPVDLHVIALKREEVPAAPNPAEAVAMAAPEDAPEAIDTKPVDPIASAAAAIDKAEAEAQAAPAAAAPGAPLNGLKPVMNETAVAGATGAVAPAAAAAPAGKPLPKGFIQLGIFSVETNANRAADQVRAAGILPTVRREQSQGKTFWRVVVGPATTAAERDDLLKKVKGLGYADAYLVSK